MGYKMPPNLLLDSIRKDLQLGSDRDLANILDMQHATISRFRSNKYPLGPALILAIHETVGYPVAKIREMHIEQLLINSGKRV